jgi:RNA polymerase sigma-70 factor, ECF subfamily
MQTKSEQKNSSGVLIEKAAAGDVYSFKLLVDEFSGYVFSLAFKTLFNKEDAKDIVQESFIRAWKHLKNYKPEIKFTTWLYAIVVNLCYDKIKSEKRRNRLFDNLNNDRIDIIAPQISELEETISNKDMILKIEQLSQGLSSKQRMVFVLRDLQNLTVEETSQILNISAGAVKTNLFHARKFIAGKLSGFERKEDKHEMR